MIGLGLGIHKSNNVLSSLKLLTRNSDFAFWIDKATGTSKGTNSPQVNPIQDLVGNADGTLQGFGFIPTSGYVDVVAPNGKTVTGLQGDGANDVILLPSNAPNPVGLQDFGFAFVFKTGATHKYQYIYSAGNPSSVASPHLGIQLYDTGTLVTFCGIVSPTAFNLATNTFYKLIMKRKSGVWTVRVNDTVRYNSANGENISATKLSRLMARINSADGSTNTDFSNALLLYADYNNGDNIDAWEADQNKAIAKIYGL